MQCSRFFRTVVATAILVAEMARPADAQYRQSALVTSPLLAKARVEAGITVLEHDRTAFDRAPQLVVAPAAVTRVNGANGDGTYDLTWAFNGALFSDGRIATFASIGAKVLVFGADGQPSKAYDRHGQGPGEMTAPSNMFALPGDTMLLIDGANKRINWLHPDKGFVAMRPRGLEQPAPFENAVGVLPGGRIVVTSGGLVQKAKPGAVTRPEAGVVVLNPDGHAKEIARLPDLELVETATNYRGRAGKTSSVIGFSRHAIAMVWDTLVATSSGDGFTIDLRNGDGAVVSRINVAVPRRPVNKAMRDTYIAQQLERLHRPGSEGLVDASESERLIREAPFADSLPPHSAFFVTPNRTLWVLDAATPADAGWSATAFRKDGAIVGRLHVDGKGRPLAFGDDRVLVRTEDADGLVSLAVQRLVVKAK